MLSYLVGLYAYFFNLTFYLRSCFEYATREGFGVPARMRRPAWACASRHCDKHPFYICWFYQRWDIWSLLNIISRLKYIISKEAFFELADDH